MPYPITEQAKLPVLSPRYLFHVNHQAGKLQILFISFWYDSIRELNPGLPTAELILEPIHDPAAHLN